MKGSDLSNDRLHTYGVLEYGVLCRSSYSVSKYGVRPENNLRAIKELGPFGSLGVHGAATGGCVGKPIVSLYGMV